MKIIKNKKPLEVETEDEEDDDEELKSFSKKRIYRFLEKTGISLIGGDMSTESAQKIVDGAALYVQEVLKLVAQETKDNIEFEKALKWDFKEWRRLMKLRPKEIFESQKQLQSKN